MKTPALIFAGLCVPAVACAQQWFPGPPRAISLSTSASRDAPVLELVYGPRPQLSLGGELGLLFRPGQPWDARVSTYALAAFENGSSLAPPPDELMRMLFGVTASFARPAPRWLGRRGVLEVSLGVGREQAFTLGGYVLPDAPRPDGIPFGGGGTFLEPDVAWRAPFGAMELAVRVDDRLHLPGVLAIFGQRVPAETAADYTSDAFFNATAVDAIARWRRAGVVQPLVSLHGDLSFPVDPTARVAYFGRALGGVAVSGASGELIAFLSGDVGNGQGWLINRHERRLSVGVRYAPF